MLFSIFFSLPILKLPNKCSTNIFAIMISKDNCLWNTIKHCIHNQVFLMDAGSKNDSYIVYAFFFLFWWSLSFRCVLIEILFDSLSVEILIRFDVFIEIDYYACSRKLWIELIKKKWTKYYKFLIEMNNSTLSRIWIEIYLKITLQTITWTILGSNNSENHFEKKKYLY